MSRPDDVESTLRNFISEFNRAADGDIQKIERVLSGDKTLTINELGSTPESWTEDALIDPLLRTAGLNKTPGRPSSQRATPDFHLEQGAAGEIIGESKSLNKIDVAEQELVEDYMSKKSWPDYGIATDGIEWVLYRAERGGDFTEYNEVRRINLRPAIQELARELGYIAQQEAVEVDIDSSLEEFLAVFHPDNLIPLLTEEAPRAFRDQRKRDVGEFYELYIELLFGESSKYEDGYDTCLRDDIIAPKGNSQKENDIFAVRLVNRLLFIKFLETRDVVPEGFLLQRVNDYNEDVPGTLYKTVIEPLFYDLFNVPKEDRRPDHRRGWFSEVPYLNGGLFRANISDEKEYDVLDRTLPKLITDLIEGTELDLELDPAILGSVFEKAINHLSESEDRQKEIGAYYTPNDVTRLVNKGAVDEKMRDVIITSYEEELSQPEEFRAEVNEMELEGLLSRIEEGAGWFGNSEAMEKSKNHLANLKVLDPACGSGHFLTAAMEEIYQVMSSLYRGLNGGDDPSPKEQYEMKKTLALNAIYGVDIDQISGEIAKLRIWLKIVKDNGWETSFSQLPNIDVNILPGNSLIGLPEKSSGQSSLDAFDLDLDQIQEVRQQYKDEQIDRGELNDQIRSLRPELREQYLSRLNHYFEDEIKSKNKWDSVTSSLDSLYPTFEKITVRRGDNNQFSDDLKSRLEGVGFHVEPRFGKSAKLEDSEIDEVDAEAIRSVFNQECYLEVQRQLTAFDLEAVTQYEDLSYGPFHWVVEFPEVVGRNGNGYSVNFDIIVGNPPYGDVLTDVEKRFIQGYKTGGINDIAHQFVEREIHLLSEDGYFGNITTLRLVYQSTIQEYHSVLRENLKGIRIACFGFRPSYVFDNAEVDVGVTTGKKDKSELGEIKTSDFILFNRDNREEKLQDIEYGDTEGLTLKDRIGGNQGHRAVLPKVGPEIKRSLLEKLKNLSTDNQFRLFEDGFDRENAWEDELIVYRRRGASYWTNPMLEKLYDGSEIEEMYFESELERDFGFLLINSSLFYTYWFTYSNFRHLNWMYINPFPIPEAELLKPHSQEISELSQELWKEMKDSFTLSQQNRGYFHMHGLKHLIDKADSLLADIYGLSDEELQFVQSYITDLGEGSGRAGTAEESLDKYNQFSS